MVSDSYTVPADNAWQATATVVRRDVVADWLEKARSSDSGDILVFGSRTMWNALLEQGLVDELHLMIGPTALTDGTPLFAAPAELTLLAVRRFTESDNLLAIYGSRR